VSHKQHDFEIHVYVAQVDVGWTPQQAEDQIDLIHDQIVGLVRLQFGRPNANWVSLTFSAKTLEEGPLKIGALPVLHEMFPLTATVNDGVGRQQVRTAIAAMLRGGLANNKYIYEYQIADFGKESPVIYVAGMGSDERSGTFARG